MLKSATTTASAPRAIVAESLEHLLSLVQHDGKFVYAHPFGQPDIPMDGYNMLRHCGTLWFMLRAFNELDLIPEPEAAGALELGVSYAAKRFRPMTWSPGLGLVTRDAIKIGGIGLALVMLAEYRTALPRGLSPNVLPLDDTMAALQAYALEQIQDGDFLHKRRFSDGSVLPFRSNFYTGEILLGLFVAGCTEPAVVSVAESLMASGYGIAEQSHWMAYAACEGAERGLIDAALAQGYLTALMSEIVGRNDYRDRRSSTPIACRTEALTRFAMHSERHPGHFPADLSRDCLVAADENLSLQLAWYGAGQFRKCDSDDKVQIDYIQHNATAFLNRSLLV